MAKSLRKPRLKGRRFNPFALEQVEIWRTRDDKLPWREIAWRITGSRKHSDLSALHRAFTRWKKESRRGPTPILKVHDKTLHMWNAYGASHPTPWIVDATPRYAVGEWFDKLLTGVRAMRESGPDALLPWVSIAARTGCSVRFLKHHYQEWILWVEKLESDAVFLSSGVRPKR